MDDLIAFLEARLAEDEQVVHESGDVEPVWDDYKLFVLDDDYKHNTVVVPGLRVLRDVQADRDLITAYREAKAYYDANTHVPAGEVTGLGAALKIRAARFAKHKDYPKEQS